MNSWQRVFHRGSGVGLVGKSCGGQVAFAHEAFAHATNKARAARVAGDAARSMMNRTMVEGARMSAGGCGDASVVHGTAAELFQLAALLMGDQAEAIALVEETLASIEIDPCLDPSAARRVTRQQILVRGLARLRELDPLSFAEVAGGASSVCVEDEDLSAAGISQAQLAEWLASEGRQDLRDWLRALPGAQRAIFVQRAVLGQANTEVAAALAATLEASGASLAPWSPGAVGEMYRLALCSLANSLAHAPAVLAGTPAHEAALSA